MKDFLNRRNLIIVFSFFSLLIIIFFASRVIYTGFPDKHVGGHFPEFGTYCKALSNGYNPYLGTREGVRLKEHAEKSDYNSPIDYLNTNLYLARYYLRVGSIFKAIDLLEQLDSYNKETQNDPRFEREILWELVSSNMKQGELDNCVGPENPFICSLPLDRSKYQELDKGSSEAISSLNRLLAIDPNDLKARWLLNVAYMTLGKYPEEVPATYLIEKSQLVGRPSDIQEFQEVSTERGLYQQTMAGGSIIEDFNNDGHLDIVTSTWDPCGSMAYFKNDGKGHFTNATEQSGLDLQTGGVNLLLGDYNNDGWFDIFVMRGGWLRLDGMMRNSLLRNNHDGTFTDVSKESGVDYPAYPTQSAAWGDMDNDGDLDLFVCNESISQFDRDIMYPSQLFLNDGDGRFHDISAQAGTRNYRYCKGSVWGDYDNDGDMDIYVSNFGEENRLYHNNGDYTFQDLAKESGVSEPLNSFAAWFWDYNNDGLLDLFVAGYGTDIEEVAADYMGLKSSGTRPKLYKNDPQNGFVDVTQTVGLNRVHLTMGANFGDIDNDGYLDVYLGTGAPSLEAIGPNIMYNNLEGEYFNDVTFSGRFGHLQKGHGVAFGDLDSDGDQDVFIQLGGFYVTDKFTNALYENPGTDNHWLGVKLIGTVSNVAGVGAMIKVSTRTQTGKDEVFYKHINSGGSFGASSLQQIIGLGQAKEITKLESRWPGKRHEQVFTKVPLD